MPNRPDPKSITTHRLHKKAKAVTRRNMFRGMFEGIKQESFEARKKIVEARPRLEPRQEELIIVHLRMIDRKVNNLMRELKIDD